VAWGARNVNIDAVEATGVGRGGDGSGHEIDPIPEVSGEYAVADGVAGRSAILPDSCRRVAETILFSDR
jgi:hypothetical protein